MVAPNPNPPVGPHIPSGGTPTLDEFGELSIGVHVGTAITGSNDDTTVNQGMGVRGVSAGGIGVKGESNAFDAIVGETNSDAHAGVTGRNLTNGANGGVGIYGVGGKFAGKFDGDVQVNGTLNVSVDINLTGAGDFAEEFDLLEAADADPGTVMVLDGVGGVKPSSLAYDRKVAGIISGGGEYRPGIILDKHASAGPRTALALVGKVYCRVDANYAPIEIGDMLTTSPTRGHAMKAADAVKSFGAVIGKALRPIAAGEGLIPVLVALQ